MLPQHCLADVACLWTSKKFQWRFYKTFHIASGESTQMVFSKISAWTWLVHQYTSDHNLSASYLYANSPIAIMYENILIVALRYSFFINIGWEKNTYFRYQLRYNTVAMAWSNITSFYCFSGLCLRVRIIFFLTWKIEWCSSSRLRGTAEREEQPWKVENLKLSMNHFKSNFTATNTFNSTHFPWIQIWHEFF